MPSSDKGFDQIQAPHMVDELQVLAFDGKESLISAPTAAQYRFSNLAEENIQEVLVIGGNRVKIGGVGVDQLTFDQTKLLVGIFSSDFSENDKEVKIYYPHVRGGKTVGKTVFLMSTGVAALLTKRLGLFQGIDDQTMATGLTSMTTRFTLMGDKAFEIHNNDAAPAIGEIIQRSIQTR